MWKKSSVALIMWVPLDVDPSFTWILAVRMVQLKIKFAGYILQLISRSALVQFSVCFLGNLVTNLPIGGAAALNPLC